jgi:CubicO group peptidase (beta-lactamase class C family)
MSRRQLTTFTLGLVGACGTLGCAGARQGAVPVDAAALRPAVERLMARERVEGLALAVIDRGKVAHVEAFGRRSRERDLPLTTSTVMYGASLTKTAFAYMVMQLVDEGRLDLDASVADLLPKPLPRYEEFTDLANDERWRALTPRILLTHTSGFANFRWLEPDRRLRFHFDPGTRYGYSGSTSSSCCWRRSSAWTWARRCRRVCSTASAWSTRA